MRSCVIKSCRNNSSKCHKDQGITFHRFPLQTSETKPWVAIVRRTRNDPEWCPTKHSTVCSKHFDEKDLYLTKKGLKRVVQSGYPKKHLNQHLAGIEADDPRPAETMSVKEGMTTVDGPTICDVYARAPSSTLNQLNADPLHLPLHTPQTSPLPQQSASAVVNIKSCVKAENSSDNDELEASNDEIDEYNDEINANNDKIDANNDKIDANNDENDAHNDENDAHNDNETLVYAVYARFPVKATDPSQVQTSQAVFVNTVRTKPEYKTECTLQNVQVQGRTSRVVKNEPTRSYITQSSIDKLELLKFKHRVSELEKVKKVLAAKIQLRDRHVKRLKIRNKILVDKLKELKRSRQEDPAISN